MAGFSHLDAEGNANMVDVSAKDVTLREARARSRVEMSAQTLAQILSGSASKGDVLAVARVAGIQAAKRTWELIPLCHSLPLDKVEVHFEQQGEGVLEVSALCRTRASTGVEMEALTAVSVAALTVYDMCKAVDRAMVIRDTCLIEKSGGRSGHYRRDDD